MVASMSEAAQLFVKYDYGETKDLLKTFLTLVSATLVLSLTFAEKIVGFGKADVRTRYTLFGAWVLFIVAIILAGLAMCFIAAATGVVMYGAIPFFHQSYRVWALLSWSCTILSGAAYVAGLIGLALAAARAISKSDLDDHGAG